MPEKKQPMRTIGFFEQVKSALAHYADRRWLGEQSPLAAPYFLGEVLHGTTPSALERGKVLIQTIDQTLESLWGGPLPTDGQTMLATVADEESQHGRGGRYDCLILELNYFQRRFKPAPKSQSEIYNDILHIARPTHDRHLHDAIERLGALLLQRLRPALRPEQPMLTTLLIGREAVVADLLAHLQQRKSVSLSGAGGVGKTSIGAAISDQWASPAVFWFTIRATFNDQLDSLLFALGHFLHRHGASTLWHQLVADGGRLKDNHLALGLASADLAALDYLPLLCFDELDFLRPATDQPNPQHLKLLEFIDSLRGRVPMLLIGQRAFWESDVLRSVEGLSIEQLGAFLRAVAIPHSGEDVARLYAYSAGNARLVQLCAALYHSEHHETASQPADRESLSRVLDQLPQSPNLLPLWHRLDRRLPAVERQLLHLLAVFRTAAPTDVWTQDTWTQDVGAQDVYKPSEAASALQQLQERRLVIADARGGVVLLPALREVIYNELSVESREHYHQQAAAIRAERGEYTSAAYHLWQADQPEAAVELWYPHRRAEINRGQASAALAIFEQISQRRLRAKLGKELLLLRSELYQLRGESEKVIETLEQERWLPQEKESVDASFLLGRALERQGKVEQSLSTYTNGIDVAAGLLSKMVHLHVQRSLTYLHERAMTDAWREVQIARYLAEDMLGTMHEQSGNLIAARTHYESALAIAQEADYLVGIAKTYHNLGNVSCRQLEIEQALDYYNQAMISHRRFGNQVGIEVARSGLVTTFMQAARYRESIQPGRQALTFFQAMGDSFWIALNASNLAEASVELEELDEAETYAQMVLEQEQAHSHPYALFTLGRVRQQQQRLEEAQLYLSQARKVAEMNGDRYLLAYVWEALGKIYQKVGNLSAAQDAYNQSHTEFQNLKIANKVEELVQSIGELNF